MTRSSSSLDAEEDLVDVGRIGVEESTEEFPMKMKTRE